MMSIFGHLIYAYYSIPITIQTAVYIHTYIHTYIHVSPFRVLLPTLAGAAVTSASRSHPFKIQVLIRLDHDLHTYIHTYSNKIIGWLLGLLCISVVTENTYIMNFNNNIQQPFHIIVFLHRANHYRHSTYTRD
jgi:hypothetical protein